MVSISDTVKRLPHQSTSTYPSSRWARPPPGSHKTQPWDFMARKSRSTVCVVRRLRDDLATIALQQQFDNPRSDRPPSREIVQEAIHVDPIVPRVVGPELVPDLFVLYAPQIDAGVVGERKQITIDHEILEPVPEEGLDFAQTLSFCPHAPLFGSE